MIVTFYSFKGGVGRSMALVNVAELLADAGYKVLACDWDLEAPGLERYFAEDPGQVLEYRKNPGVVDLLVEYKETLVRPIASQEAPTADEAENFRTIGKEGLCVRNPVSYAVKVSGTQRQSGGWIKLLSAGRRDGEWDARYTGALRDFDWTEFYSKWAGGAYLDFFRREVEVAADIILIDSRTGVTEAGGVCTHHLPDLVLLFSAANDQNVEGTRWMAEILSKPSLKEQRAGRDLAIFPITSRIERNADVDLLTPFRKRFVAEFSRYLPAELENLGTFIEQSEIPYIAKYSFRESIVARQPRQDRLRELASPYEVISEAIVKLGSVRQLLGNPGSGQPLTRSAPEATRITAPVPGGQFLVVSATDNSEQNQPLIEELRSAGLKVWSESDVLPAGLSRISAYYEALERSAGCLLLVGPSVDELRLVAQINFILAQQAQKPNYRVLLLIQSGTDERDVRNPLLRRLPTLDLSAEGMPANSAQIVAALLPEPALIPEPDREHVREKLKSTTEAESRFFLGRDLEIHSVLSWLDEAIQADRHIALLSGDAGEGKTALVQAGLIPALRRGLLGGDGRSWQIANIIISQDPLEETARVLRELSGDLPSQNTSQRLGGDEESRLADIEGQVGQFIASERPFAFFFDGLDTTALRSGWESEPVRRFFLLLDRLRKFSRAKTLVVVSIRSSLLGSFLERKPEFLSKRDVFTLPRMTPEGMRTCLEGAARLLALRFEPGLVERILADAIRTGVASRSVRVLLFHLCQKTRGDLLTHEEYAAIGGVEGVTIDEVGRTLAGISGPPLSATRTMITSLIQVRTGARLSLARETLLELADRAEGSGEALIQLIDWDVLTLSDGGLVTLASDAITKLDIVQQWVREDYERLKLQADLDDLAQKWDEAGRPDHLLPRADALSRYRHIRAAGPLPIALLEAADRAEKKRQSRDLKLGLSLIGGLVVLLALGSFGIYGLVHSRATIASLEEGKRTADEVSKTLRNEKVDLQRQNEKLIDQNAKLQAELKANAGQPNAQEPGASKRSSSDSPSSVEIVPSTTPETYPSPSSSNPTLSPRIYLETGSAAGASSAKRLAAQLREKGFVVQPPRNASGGELGYSEVKYYFPEDVSEATSLVSTLRGLGVENLRTEPRQVLGPPDARPRHFDVWIEPSRGVQSAPAATPGDQRTVAERDALVADSSKARLFFFVTNEQQRTKVWALAPRLEEQGLYVANVLMNTGKQEETTVVRYFRYPQDKTEAGKINKALQALGVKRSRISYVNDPDSAGGGRKFQVWIRKGDLAP